MPIVLSQIDQVGGAGPGRQPYKFYQQSALLQKDEMFCVWKKSIGFQHIVLREKSIEKKYVGASYEPIMKVNYKKNNKFAAWS